MLILLTGCYDDSALWTEVNDHEARLAKLETLCSQMNTNISSLQTIVSALEDADYVTNITPITAGGVQMGYTISFKRHDPITIYHGSNGADGKDGSDGQDGHTPVIGVKKQTDGNLYWTIDGNWMIDSNGAMIPATGKDGANGADGKDGKDGADGKDGKDGADGKDGVDGKDGITPQLKIEDGYWYVSYDNSKTWQILYKAVGEDGDSFFQSVTYNDDVLKIVLKNGTEIELPRHIDLELDIEFEKTDSIFCEPGTSVTVSFKIVGGEVAQIYTIGENGWTGDVAIDNQTKSGSVTITAPAVSASGKVLVFATDTYGHLVMKALTFIDKIMSIPTLSYNVAKAGGTVEVNIRTNLDYNIIIPESASSWLKYISTKAVRDEVVSFSISANENTLGRSAEVKIVSHDGSMSETLLIYQEGDRYYSSGSGIESDPYIIDNIGEWQNLANVVATGETFEDVYFKLGEDLDFSSATIAAMGSEAAPFSGNIDANGKTISNVKISGSSNLGLFGYIKDATLTGFTVSSITVSGTSYMGGLVGYAVSSTIKGAYVSGSIKSGSNIGGIAGYAKSTQIDRCENGVSLGNTNSTDIGGIAGKLESSSITNSVNSGSLTGYDSMGGIAGYIDSSSSVKNCCNNKQFTQGSLYGSIGGIVGYNCGTLCACAMNNSINGTVQLSYSMVGCIVGYDHTTASCRYCYYLKYTILNKNFTHCGDLNWGSWSYYGEYDAYGKNTSGQSVTTLLNQWVSANSTSSMTYRTWSGTYPKLAD